MQKIALGSLVALLAGCAAAPTETEISAKLTGMSRMEVLTCMPRLASSTKDGDSEILRFSRTDDSYMGLRAQCDAEVRMKAGRVDQVWINAASAGMYGVKSNICRELLRKCLAK